MSILVILIWHCPLGRNKIEGYALTKKTGRHINDRQDWRESFRHGPRSQVCDLVVERVDFHILTRIVQADQQINAKLEQRH